MKTQYIFIGTYALERGGKYELFYRTHCCVCLEADHDGDPVNEVRSIQTAMVKLENEHKQNWAKSIIRDYGVAQAIADDLVSPAYWLSASLTPSLSGLKSE